MRKSGRAEARGFLGVALLVAAMAGGCAGPIELADDAPRVSSTYLTVVVHKGDTVSEIAQRYSVSTGTLARMNGLSDGDPIYAGETLRVPAGSHATRVAVMKESEAPRYASWNTPGAPIKPVTVRTIAPVHVKPSRPAPAQEPAHDSDNAVYASAGDFEWPVEGRIILGFGGGIDGTKNDGINISARAGDPIHAAAAGTVIYAGNELKGYGNLVLIKHDNGYTTAYAHASSIAVARGDRVGKGQVIGYAGSTGDVSSPQVHFEIRDGVKPIDPKPLLMASRES
ncbi:MAG TPA: M23 family metallopeptidase [Rhizomicrobium sp.]|nr:M23 family metallopeptidase [Rhizomicrobium sp.]